MFTVEFGTIGGRIATLRFGPRKQAQMAAMAIARVWLDEEPDAGFCKLSKHCARWSRSEPSGRFVEARNYA